MGQRAEGMGQRAEGMGQRAEGMGQRAEGMGQRAEGMGQRAEGKKRVSCCGLRGAGCGEGLPQKERFAIGALRLRSVPSELETFLPPRRKSGIF